MDAEHFTSGPGDDAVGITRVADGQWQALDGDVVAGCGYGQRRADGRMFVGIDAWRGEAFDRLAEAMAAELPGPLYTVVDESDTELTAAWRRAGFAVRRREWEYAVPTDPALTGLGDVRPPAGVTVVPAGRTDERMLRAVDRAVRDEVDAAGGWWRTMPAEVIPRDPDDTIVDPAGYAVAAGPDRYLGLIRVVRTKRPRIGLIAVLAAERRRGIGRALLAHALGTLHGAGHDTAWAEAHESNLAACALLDGAGARRVGSNLELVR
jgi:ribosomal protein S18 acetylase RimI-like enzyme